MCKVYKPIIKQFMGMEVRVIRVDRKEYMITKDMFKALGKLDKNNQIDHRDRDKLNQFLEDIDRKLDRETFPIDFGKKKGEGRKSNGNIQDVDCLNIEVLPIVLTQFRPTARRGKEALEIWKSFMKLVDEILREFELHKYIIDDKVDQKELVEEVVEEGGNAMITNKQVNIIMAQLLGVYPQIGQIKKDELKKYQPQISIDLLEVRAFVLKKFKDGYIITGSHKEAREIALKLSKRKYKID